MFLNWQCWSTAAFTISFMPKARLVPVATTSPMTSEVWVGKYIFLYPFSVMCHDSESWSSRARWALMKLVLWRVQP